MWCTAKGKDDKEFFDTLPSGGMARAPYPWILTHAPYPCSVTALTKEVMLWQFLTILLSLPCNICFWNPVSHHAMQEPKGHRKATCGYSGPQPLWDPSPLHPPDAQGWPQVCPGQPACEHTPLSNEDRELPSWAQSPPEAGAITVLNECCFIPLRGRVCFTGTDKQNLTLWRSNELRVVKRHIHRRSRVSTPHIWLSTTSQEQMEGGGGHDFAPSSSCCLCSIQFIKPQVLLWLKEIEEGCLLASFLHS